VPGGPAFVPGEGAGEVLLEVEGRRCRVQRDLPRERRLAQDVADACPALGGGGWEWPLEEPVACLGLMLDLEPLKDQVRVAWPEGERFRTPQRAVASGLSLALRGEGHWFALDGRLQLDEGRVLSLQDLLDLLPKAKGAFVPLGDGLWLSLERHFRERLEGLRALAVPQGGTLRLAPAAALALEELTETVGSFSAPKAWKDRAATIRRAFGTTFPVPPTLQARLRPYQEEGFQWLARLAEAGLGACLADDMGLGKTVQALALLLLRASRGPALVVAPTSVVGNWAVEARRFAPTLEVVVHGEGDRAALLENAGPYTLVLCSYGLLVQDQALLTARTWGTVILDEAQAVKNADTQRSKAVMALQAEARLVMSGTPVENHLGELWNLFRFLNPGLLGSAEHFTRTYALPIERDQNRASLRHLKRLLGPFLLRRAKHEVLQELPSLTEIVHEVVLSPDERAFYEVLRRGALKKLSSAGLAGGPGQIQILAELMRLRRACCHPRLVEPGLALASAKLEAFVEILAELRENRHRALVFSQFVDHLAVLREHLDAAQIPYQYLDGSTPAPARRKSIDAFQAGAGEVFLISLKAGGTGLNLTAADYVIHMDPWWNPAVEDQASSRAHRYGQDRPVTVYRLVAKDTIEEKILALHHQKRKLAEGILEGAGTAAVLSAEDLMDLLRA
jgi:SNF2 family DNA or RNA helicase